MIVKKIIEIISLSSMNSLGFLSTNDTVKIFISCFKQCFVSNNAASDTYSVQYFTSSDYIDEV